MSEPTTAAVPKPEDKQTEVTPAVEPSPETVVENSVPDAPEETVKEQEPTKTETPAVTKTADPSSAPAPEPKEGDKPEERPRSPSFFTRLRNFKIPRGTGKKEKEKAKAPAPAKEEPAVPTEEPSPADAKPEDKPEGVPADPVKEEGAPADPVKEVAEVETTPAPAEPEAPVPPTTQEEPKSGEGPKDDKEDVKPTRAVKLGRRLSKLATGVTGAVGHVLLPNRRSQGDPVAKVDEEPPKIKEPAPVGPLENPAADSTPATGEEPKKEEPKETNEPPKIIDSTPAPVVAAA